MSACPDCPRYGIGPDRRTVCCLEQHEKFDMQAQMEALKDRQRRAELAASQTPTNRHARRRLAKLAR